MLRIFIGRAGSGKTSAIMREVGEEVRLKEGQHNNSARSVQLCVDANFCSPRVLPASMPGNRLFFT